MPETKKDIINELRKDLLLLQGFRAGSGSTIDVGLGSVTDAFPNAVFPTGAIHEFLSDQASGAAASGGFVACLAGSLMRFGGACVWIGYGRKIFPPALTAWGIKADQVIFVDVKKEKEVLWATEEALKCEGLAAVVSETREIGFIASRRLQLAVEKSGVTGFILRNNTTNLNPIACIARWKITPLDSKLHSDMPGLGFPRWSVELVKVRNGQPGIWQMEWVLGRFRPIFPVIAVLPEKQRRKTG